MMSVSLRYNDLLQMTADINALQRPDGSISAEHLQTGVVRKQIEQTAALASNIALKFGQTAYADAILTDTHNWERAGLDTPPNFERSRLSIEAPQQGQPFMFWGPLRTPNSARQHGWMLETFVVSSDIPQTLPFQQLYAAYPHPKNICTSSHLLAGSNSLTQGNVLVFFPENVRADSPLEKQQMALFFFNKFSAIYRQVTTPLWDRVGVPSELTASRGLDERTFYEARCVWGYLHDYFHHKGPRPFDVNVGIKTKFYPGILEELKVDLQTLVASRTGGVLHGNAVSEFILFERICRYPLQQDWSKNFDAGTGLVLLSHLHDTKALQFKNGRLSIDMDTTIESAKKLITDVEAIEKLENKEYVAAAKSLVGKYLPPADASDPKSRFGMPEFLRGTEFSKMIGQQPTINFEFNVASIDAAEQLRLGPLVKDLSPVFHQRLG